MGMWAKLTLRPLVAAGATPCFWRLAGKNLSSWGFRYACKPACLLIQSVCFPDLCHWGYSMRMLHELSALQKIMVGKLMGSTAALGQAFDQAEITPMQRMSRAEQCRVAEGL